MRHHLKYYNLGECLFGTAFSLSVQPKNYWFPIQLIHYQLVWSDEFDIDGLPQSSHWTFEEGGHGWGNNEKQYYLANSLENAYVKEGKLYIVALTKKYMRTIIILQPN
jgi:hypothetical protein